jgi:hypothetical protein
MSISESTRLYIGHLRSSAHIDPVRDWLILMTLFIFSLICIIVWNVWAFDTVARGGVIGSSVKSTSPVFNSSSLETIRGVFEKRAAEESKYVNGVYRYADPSQ